MSPTVDDCSAVTPAGKHVRRSFAGNYDTTRDWAERVTGLKVDRDLNGRGGKLKCRPPQGRATFRHRGRPSIFVDRYSTAQPINASAERDEEHYEYVHRHHKIVCSFGRARM